MNNETETPILPAQAEVEHLEPWVNFAGMFKDDPLFDDFVEAMAAYRREVDAVDVENEIALESSQLV
ncbi:hypothetical protein [[Phormidium] sp. ETS-05]|uniref:hypothetical protein n=1 Tax=[Phormidium] sp. ETS-05 TaxID=222819 RepID=UPI0018EF1857|nr:hypothetical protein [[Phormidium] sp. ETS-05]